MAVAGPETEEGSSEPRMTFFEHLEELRRRLKVVALVIGIFFVLFLVFSLLPVTVAGVGLAAPIPAFLYDGDPIANKFFRLLRDFLVPSWVQIAPLHPWDGFVVQMKVALFLALLASMPVIAYEASAFIGPALRPAERRLILRVVVPVIGLFFAGSLIALVVVLPFAINFMFAVSLQIGIDLPLLFLDDFISFVLLFVVGFGLAFELPVIMYGLSVVGMIHADFWKKYWRFAAIAIFLFGAIITPDGSGVTMLLVSIPMLGLYVIGYAFAAHHEALRARAKSS